MTPQRLFWRLCLPLCWIVWIGVPSHAVALPHMALLTGAPCSTCHINEQGGGMRTAIGWGSMAHVGAVTYDQVGLRWLDERMTNDILEDRVAVGWDIRLQSARIGAPDVRVDEEGSIRASLPERDTFLMQAQPYVSAVLHDAVTLYGTWNAGRDTFREGDFCDTPYGGQSCYELQAILSPSRTLPTLRIGKLQPSVGLRHDDHTMLLRQNAATARAPVLPPNYAEWGGEAHWQPRHWLQIDGAGFSASNLSDALGDTDLLDSHQFGGSSRVSFLPRLRLGQGIDLMGIVGGSTLLAGGFRMDNLFAGVGWMDRVSLLLESAWLHYDTDITQRARNLSAMLTVQTTTWLLVQGRLEEGWARRDERTFLQHAFVLGLHVYPVPWIKIRPEYRYESNDRFESAQYTVQLHLFY